MGLSFSKGTCVRCGSPVGGQARRGEVCPGCLLAEGASPGVDVNWVRDRFPQLEGAVEAPGFERGDGNLSDDDGGMRVFEAREFESGRAVLLWLWPLEPGARQVAELERRANLTHSGVAAVLDFGEVDEWVYAIEARPEGQRLREAISQAEVNRGDMLRLVPEISAVVRYAAELGVVLGAEPDTVFVSGEGRVTLSGMPGVAGNGKPGEDAGGVAWVERHPAVGTRVGRYELLEMIGEGGFAEVYRAREERPVRREVALKILKPGMDTRQVLARFATERQALALMSHRGIATIFDAGSTESGRPWIAMELVEGKPLTAFCDERCLPLRDRAALVASICRAVQHGHEKGVVHRDLKPSNVLVSVVDGKPAATVIDFGIATATEPTGAGTFFTRTHQFLGSPSYMSPEQDGAETDARSDVYALGVMLYELMTGEPPLSDSSVRDRGLREVIERVQREEAAHPADRVAGCGAERREELAGRRGVGGRELITELGGDLSGIVMRALRKKPDQRYGSAAEMAEDLEDWGRGQPVAAPGARCRAARWWRRALLGVAVLGLAAGLTAWLVPEGARLEKGTARDKVPEAAPAWAVRHPVRSRDAGGVVRPVALFQFDGDLKSALRDGPDLEAVGKPALKFETRELSGMPAGVMHGPRFLPEQWLKCENVIGINGPPDATESNDWTLVFDVMFPSLAGPVGLFQCDSENRAVAELYVGPGGLGDTDFGIQYGKIREGEWYRIVVVSSHSDRSQLYATWVNGTRWGVPHVRGMNSAQFAFDDALLFFCEGNQKTGAFVVNSLAVYDVPLADHEIRALGPPVAPGVPPELHPGPVRELPGLLQAGPRLVSGDVRPGDYCGTAVAVSGDEAWCGIPGSDAAQVDGGEIGRWRRDVRGRWLWQGRLTIPDAGAGGGLGMSLALSGDTGVAGAPETADRGIGTGAAWLFTRDAAGSAWMPTRLNGQDLRAGARMGHAVALAGTGPVAVSAPGLAGTGRVFVFDARTGNLRAALTPPDGLEDFGKCMAAAEGVLVVGASQAGTGGAGAALVFVSRNDTDWQLGQVLEAPEGLDGLAFAESLALSPAGGLLAVGAPAADGAGGAAVVCVFARTGAGPWELSRTIAAPEDGFAETRFAAALAFPDEDVLLIGDPGTGSGGRRTGGIHVMQRDAENGSFQRARLIVPDEGTQEGHFGASLAVNARTLWTGAPADLTDHASGGAAWALDLPAFERQRFATERPDAGTGASVAIRDAWAVVGTPGRDARDHGGSGQMFRLDISGERWQKAGMLSIPNDSGMTGKFGQCVISAGRLWATAGILVHEFRMDRDESWRHQQVVNVGGATRIAGEGTWLLCPQTGFLTTLHAGEPGLLKSGKLALGCDMSGDVAMSGRTALVSLEDPRRAVAVLECGDPSVMAAAWRHTGTLTLPGPEAGGRWFGRAVALDGDRALIGAPAADRQGGGRGEGGAWVFRRTGDRWTVEEKLEFPLRTGLSALGTSVALRGDFALVGCPRTAMGLGHGMVAVFRRNALTNHWRPDRILEASNAEPGDGFGIDVDLNRRYAIIAAKSPWAYFFELPP